MRIPKPPGKALLFVAALWAGQQHFLSSRELLLAAFGEIAMEGPAVRWDYSDYYLEELGHPLFRKFLFFRELIDQGTIADLKLRANGIEESLSAQGRRTVNLDPGYLTPAKIVLASTKDYAHRVYLRDGIFAEVTLTFRKGAFLPHINTYRDYQDDRHLRTLLMARTLFAALTQSPDRSRSPAPFTR